jgi:hypothetical protein
MVFRHALVDQHARPDHSRSPLEAVAGTLTSERSKGESDRD